MGRPFVQFGPQTFGLPVVQPLLQLAVKVPEVFGIDGQLPAELREVLLHILTTLGLHEQVEQRVSGIDRILLRHGGGRTPSQSVSAVRCETGGNEVIQELPTWKSLNTRETFTVNDQSFLFYRGSPACKVCPGESIPSTRNYSANT